jgi:effector-binding domain-containing protein
MRTRTLIIALVSAASILVTLSATPTRGAKDAEPAAQKQAAVKEGGEQFSTVHVRTLGEQPFFYAEIETSFQELGEAVVPTLEELEKLEQDKKVTFTGTAVFVYRNATMDPNAKFKLQVGFPVKEGTAGQGRFKVRKLAPFKCATLLYGGPLSSVGQAYEKLMGAVGERKRTGESREYYLHWEGVDSPNNVEMIAIGIE